MTLRQLLNKRRWHFGDLDLIELVIRHRGAPDDCKRVPGYAITSISPRGVLVDAFLIGDNADEAATFIPYHRFLAIFRGQVALWSSPLC